MQVEFDYISGMQGKICEYPYAFINVQSQIFNEKDFSNFSPSINIPKPKYSVRSHGQSERLANRGKRGMWRGIQTGGEPHKNISQSVSSLLQKGFKKIPALCQTEGHRPIHRSLSGSSNDKATHH